VYILHTDLHHEKLVIFPMNDIRTNEVCHYSFHFEFKILTEKSMLSTGFNISWTPPDIPKERFNLRQVAELTFPYEPAHHFWQKIQKCCTIRTLLSPPAAK